MATGNYYDEKADFYRGTPNGEIARLIKGRGLNILDVGCADGALGAILKKDGHNVTGIEISASLAAAAQKKLDHVINCNVEETSAFPFGEESFDVIVFGDVLEHLFNPGTVLAKMKKFLKENGIVIISVPNFGYIKIRARAFAGNLSYERTGIMDESHLRIFNKKILLNLIEESGFRKEELGYTYSPRFPKLGGILKKIWPGLFGYQLVVKAGKK